MRSRKRRRLTAQGTHPFSLFALFKRYTTHKITESGFFKLHTTHTKVLGRSIRSSPGLLHKYADVRGEIQTEVPGRHLTSRSAGSCTPPRHATCT